MKCLICVFSCVRFHCSSPQNFSIKAKATDAFEGGIMSGSSYTLIPIAQASIESTQGLCHVQVDHGIGAIALVGGLIGRFHLQVGKKLFIGIWAQER